MSGPFLLWAPLVSPLSRCYVSAILITIQSNIMRRYSTTHRRQGFTLVEIAIALVIIALIIGGVMSGQELIRASRIRSTIHQLEEYQAAVNSFTTRFAGVPGDLSTATSQFATGTYASIANGDGDGIVEDDDANDSGTNDYDEESGEISQFWYQLSAAGMVEGSFDTGATLETSFPKAETGRYGFGVYGVIYDGNYFHIGLDTAPDPGTDNSIVTKDALTPEEASAIDGKLDDGHPKRGTILATNGTNYTGVPKYFNIASFPLRGHFFAEAIAPLFWSDAMADTAVVASRDACVFKIAADTDDAQATYAVGAGGITCQLKIRWK